MISVRPTTETGRLLAAATIGVCLFFVFYGRLPGIVATLLAVGSGVGSIALLAGYNGYDRGSESVSLQIATVIALGILAGMAFTDEQAILSRRPGMADVPSSGGVFVWVVPAILLGLLAHRLGRRVAIERSTAEE